MSILQQLNLEINHNPPGPCMCMPCLALETTELLKPRTYTC